MSTAILGVISKKSEYIVDAALIDNGSSTFSIIGELFVAGAFVTSVRQTSHRIGHDIRSINGVSDSVQTLGTMDFNFSFGGRLYCVVLHIVPKFAPLISPIRISIKWD